MGRLKDVLYRFECKVEVVSSSWDVRRRLLASSCDMSCSCQSRLCIKGMESVVSKRPWCASIKYGMNMDEPPCFSFFLRIPRCWGWGQNTMQEFGALCHYKLQRPPSLSSWVPHAHSCSVGHAVSQDVRKPLILDAHNLLGKRLVGSWRIPKTQDIDSDFWLIGSRLELAMSLAMLCNVCRVVYYPARHNREVPNRHSMRNAHFSAQKC